jgi:Family of unknown function (DUF6194)
MRIATPTDVVSPDELLSRIRRRYPGLVQITTWGARALRYDPHAAYATGIEFVRIEERDRDDDGGPLHRMGAYRVSFGMAPSRYEAQFGAPPTWQEPIGERSEESPMPVVDSLVPHPVYAWRAWASVVNPSPATVANLWPVLDESYALAVARHAERERR